MSDLREKLLHLLLDEESDSEELYVDVKAKFLIDRLVPFIENIVTQKQRQARIDELKRAKINSYIPQPHMYKFDRRIKNLEKEIET